MRSVAKKSVMRLGPQIKRTVCKRCDTLLIPGISCENRIENASKGGKKSWADVLVVGCMACGTVKRFPVGMDCKERKKGKKRGGNADFVVKVTKEGLPVADVVGKPKGSSSGSGREYGTAEKVSGHKFSQTIQGGVVVEDSMLVEEWTTDTHHKH